MVQGNQGNDQFLTLRQASSAVSTRNSPTSTKCDPRIAGRKAAQLFGCYPRNEANDPEIFITAATATLASYPELVAERVCDPLRGLPAKNKFLPAIAEIRAACETEMVWHYAVEKRDRERAKTRAVLESSKASTGSAEHTRTVKSFKELGALWPRPEPPPKAAPMDYTRSAPLVNTAAFANYLNDMRVADDVDP